MFLVIEMHLLCFGHLLWLIKILRKFELFDLFLLVQTDAELRKWEQKPRVLRVLTLY